MKLLTIGIPTYKSHSTLIDLLRDLLPQISKDHLDVCEVVISDNDPESNLLEIIHNNFPNEKLFINYNKNLNNLGYDLNLLRLVEISKSKFINFLADDERISDDYLSSLIKILTENDDVDAVVRNFFPFKKEPLEKFSNLESEELLTLNQENCYEVLKELGQKYSLVSALTFRISAIREINFVRATNFIHYYWFFCLMGKSTIIYDPNPHIYFRIGSPNFSQSRLRTLIVSAGALHALTDAKILNSGARRKLIKEHQIYLFNLSKELRYMNTFERIRALRVYLPLLFSQPVLIFIVISRSIVPSYLYRALKLAYSRIRSHLKPRDS